MPAQLTAFRGVSQDAEAREIVRRILESKTPFDDNEIAVAGPEYDTAVFAELLTKLRIPFTSLAGFPIGSVGPGKALLGYLDWVESGFEAGILERLLRSGVLTLRQVDENLSALGAARALSRFALYKGRESYQKVLDAHVVELDETIKDSTREGDDSRAQDASERLKSFGPLRAALLEIVADVEWAENEDSVDLSQAVVACMAFAARFSSAHSETDRAAVIALTETLTCLKGLGGKSVSRAQACALIRETAISSTLGAERARPGKLHLTNLENAGWEGRKTTFVTGLTLQNHPGRTSQDPFLLDEERLRLDPALVDSETLQIERSRRIMDRLASLEGQAIISAYAFDGREGRETGPAGLFLQAVRKAKSAPTSSYKEIDTLIGAPVGLPPEGGALPIDDLSWWLAGAHPQADLQAIFPWAAAGRDARLSREKPVFGIYDGFVPSANGALDPTAGTESVSSSYMSDLAACQFRFFLKRVLGIMPKKDEERDPLIWLSAAERGSLLHGVYAAFLRECGENKQGLKKERVLAMLDKDLAALRQLIPPASDALFEYEREELRNDILLFLRYTTEEWAQRLPVGREVAFGMPDADGEKLSQPEPVAVDFSGSRFLIKGSVDRVDKVGEHEYEVVDYKTGRLSDRKREQMEALPAAFQPMFYMKAVELLLKPLDPLAKVRAFVFLFSTRAGRWSRLEMGPERIKEVAENIPRLLGLLREGRFKQTEDKAECEYCAFAQACGDEPWVRAKELAP